MRIIELFGGIGACTQALKKIGIDVEIVDYVEIDKYAVASYNAINDTNFTTQDITQWNKHYDNIDLIMHGSPCQDFSLAGKQAGGDEGSGTRSSLMYETIRIVKDIKPKYVIWENVKNLLSVKHKHNFDAYIETMKELGYTNFYQVLNAKDYEIPQNRERVFTISIRNDIVDKFNKSHSFSVRHNIMSVFEFPKKKQLTIKLKDLLEDEVDEKYYLSDKAINYILDGNDVALNGGRDINNRIINPKIAKTISCRGASQQRADVTNFKIDGIEDELKVSAAKLMIKNATKKGYLEAYDGDCVNLAYPESETRRGRVGNQCSQTLQCNDNMGVVVNDDPKVLGGIGEKKSNNGTQWYQQDRIYDNNVGLSLSTTALPFYPDKKLRIRKLTPKECWRLMGFSDECFEKASKVNSNAQLYKQAGNSIVVNVLEAIFRNLIK